jgi:chromosome segregation ATPase
VSSYRLPISNILFSQKSKSPQNQSGTMSQMDGYDLTEECSDKISNLREQSKALGDQVRATTEVVENLQQQLNGGREGISTTAVINENQRAHTQDLESDFAERDIYNAMIDGLEVQSHLDLFDTGLDIDTERNISADFSAERDDNFASVQEVEAQSSTPEALDTGYDIDTEQNSYEAISSTDPLSRDETFAQIQAELAIVTSQRDEALAERDHAQRELATRTGERNGARQRVRILDDDTIEAKGREERLTAELKKSQANTENLSYEIIRLTNEITGLTTSANNADLRKSKLGEDLRKETEYDPVSDSLLEELNEIQAELQRTQEQRDGFLNRALESENIAQECNEAMGVESATYQLEAEAVRASLANIQKALEAETLEVRRLTAEQDTTMQNLQTERAERVRLQSALETLKFKSTSEFSESVAAVANERDNALLALSNITGNLQFVERERDEAIKEVEALEKIRLNYLDNLEDRDTQVKEMLEKIQELKEQEDAGLSITATLKADMDAILLQLEAEKIERQRLEARLDAAADESNAENTTVDINEVRDLVTTLQQEKDDAFEELAQTTDSLATVLQERDAANEGVRVLRAEHEIAKSALEASQELVTRYRERQMDDQQKLAELNQRIKSSPDTPLPAAKTQEVRSSTTIKAESNESLSAPPSPDQPSPSRAPIFKQLLDAVETATLKRSTPQALRLRRSTRNPKPVYKDPPISPAAPARVPKRKAGSAAKARPKKRDPDFVSSPV